MKPILGQIDLSKIFTPAVLLETLRLGIIIIGGFLLVRVVASLVRRVLARSLTEQSRLILYRLILYSGVAIIVIAALGEIGVKLSALLGAAGILGVAVGVASQTSLGNIVSGLFLVWEKSLQIGDVVTIGETTGVVHSIDLLSMKLRTFDNLLIRIPNQTIISSSLTNVTRYPIRRIDLRLRFDLTQDLNSAKGVLYQIAREIPLILDEPEPFIQFESFVDAAVVTTFGVWCHKDDYVEARNAVVLGLKSHIDGGRLRLAAPVALVRPPRRD